MVFTPETKELGNLVESKDWNEANTEIVRLEKDKVNRSGNDTIQGPLTINGILSATQGGNFSGELSVTGSVKVSEKVNIGSLQLQGFSGEDKDELPQVVWYRDTNKNWDEGLIKHSSQKGVFKKAGFGIHFHEDRQFGFWSTNWNPLFAVEGKTGNTFINGNVGIGRPDSADSGVPFAPKAKLDIATATRTGTHPTAVQGLYVTGNFKSDSDGVEFRQSDGKKGIGFGSDTIYAAGSEVNQNLGLKAKGSGQVNVTGKLSVTSDLTVSGNVTVIGKVNHRDISADGLKLDSHTHDGINSNKVKHTNLDLTDAGTNPHKTTAADVGALSLNGGTVSGDLTVKGKLFLEEFGLLDIGEQSQSVDRGGHRTWMQKGIKINWDSDNLFIGLKNEGSNRKDAVIAWGDDPQDDLRFINVPSFKLDETPQIKEIMIMKPTGNVGIGTTDPKAKLHVVGNQTLEGQLSVTGNVGIGTDKLTAKLDVKGDVSASGKITAGSATINGDLSVLGTISPAGNDANKNLELKAKGTGKVKIGSLELQGFTGNDEDEWPNVLWYQNLDQKWNEGLIKHSSQKGVFSKAGFGIHFHESRQFGFWSSGWNSLFAVEGDTGNTFIKGNVGIGTSKPTVKLEVNGSAKVTGELSVTKDLFANGKIMANNRDITIMPTATQVGALSISGGTVTGNVGIGTDSSKANLNVKGDVSASGSLSFGERNGQLINLWKTGYGIGVQTSTIYFRTDGNFAWYNGGVHKDEAGNAGSGKSLMTLTVDRNQRSNPAKLHVVGDLVLGKGTVPNTTDQEKNPKFIFHSRADENGDHLLITYDDEKGSWAWNEGITLKKGGNVGIGTSKPTVKLDVNGNAKVTGELSVTGKIMVNGKEIGANALPISGGTVTGNLSVNGNVGIGTTDPKAKLHVHDGNAIITGNGNVGIGTSNPQNKLHVVGNLVLGNDAANQKFIFYSRTNQQGDFLHITSDINTKEGWDWDWMQGIFLKRGGNVGIGIDNPTAKLHVNNGNAIITGNVSIGTDKTQAKLDVKGDVSASGKITANGNAIITGNVGIGTTDPKAKLDIATATRTGTGTHPTAVQGLYVTGNFESASNGVEFRHTNGTAGIGFGYDTIYAAGSNIDHDLGLKPKGTGQVKVSGSLSVTGSLSFGSTIRQMLNLWGTNHGIGVQHSTTYFRTSDHFAWYKGGVHKDEAWNAGSGTSLMTLDADGNFSVRGTISPIGSDTNRNLVLKGKGTGKVKVENNLWLTGILEIGVPPLSESISGNRTWMEKGIKINKIRDMTGNDSLFIGLKNKTEDKNDAVIAWGDDSYNDLRFIHLAWQNDGKEIMIMKPKGNVGIGTTDPQAKLHVNNGNAIITGTGNVGIGTTNPDKGKLHIEGFVNYRDSSGYRCFTKRSDNMKESPAAPGDYSIYASNRIGCPEFNAFSDLRIKEIKGTSDSQADLQTLLRIQVTDYHYKDKIANGNRPKKKVIGQQIADVYPQAVSTHVDVVPDIFESAIIEENWVTLNSHNLKIGDKVKIFWNDDDSQLFTVEAIEPDKFKIPLDHTGDIFVYGREVDDFHVVDYDALSMLHISATQQLYKIIKKLEQKLNEKIKD